MKKSHLLLSFLFLATLSFSQGSWTQLSDIPGPGRHHACSFVLGDSAYIATGSGFDDFYRYDIHNDSWTQLADFPGGNRNYAIGFSINGKGYVSCGYNGSSANMEMWEYDAVLDSWTQKTSGPAAGRIHPAFSVVGDRVYLGQGQQNGNFADLADWYEYNATTDTWTTKTNFMSERHHGVGATVGNMIYVGTGHHLDDMFDDWYAYNASTDQWQTRTSFPSDGRSAANAVSVGDNVYLMCGEDEINFARFDDFWQYNSIADSWSSLADFPAGGRWAPFMFVHNDTIYAGAGQNEQMNDQKDLWRYDFSGASLDENSQTLIQLFPNPVIDELTINAKSAVERVQIFSQVGNVVYDSRPNSSHLSLDLHELSQGVYLVKIQMENQMEVTERFVK
ncbi:MAG: T9SS type A sorting domain-containing protein [Crocinitomicaceae bacterium]|nr:T9SS type A sorting domain-containing protein [Crocinitomicaceae bacterium]